MAKKIKLNENDMKRTLNATKKTKQPKTVLTKNIPEYWPVLNDNQVVRFIEIIESIKDSYKEHIIIGLQSTIRNLKGKDIKLLVIADKISPRWFAKHLIAMALTKNPKLKIVIAPKMKDHTKKMFNIPAIIFCIKEGIETESLDEFYKNLNIHDELINHYQTVKPNRDVSIKKRKKETVEKLPEIIHIKKKSSSFAACDNKSESMEFDGTNDFISLGKFNDDTLSSKKSPSFPSYRPLKVKKVVGNTLRRGK